MARRTERFNFRVDEERGRRYREAAQRLGLEELSDFCRRACDELADRAGASSNSTRPAAATVKSTTTAKPLSKHEQASGRRK